VASVILVALFAYRPATTWPGLLIVMLGIPVYFLIRWVSGDPAAFSPQLGTDGFGNAE